MQVEVIEFELECPEHGVYRVQVPVELPRPRACVHCYLPVRRREVRRFTAPMPVAASAVGPAEAYVG